MKSKPLVSVIMNCYNSQTYLREAIESVLAQNYTNFELIFWDNRSTDESVTIIKSYNDKRIKYFYAKSHTSLGIARQFALEKCRGKYIAFLDTDDIWMPNKLKLQVSYLEKQSEYKMCYGSVIYINEQGQKTGVMKIKYGEDSIFERQLMHYEINMQTVLLRNDIQISFDQKKEFAPDYELFMNIALNYKTFALSEVLVKYRKAKNSLTSQKSNLWWIENKETLDKIFSNSIYKEKYKNGYTFAYAKVAYYKAYELMKLHKANDAKQELKKYKFVSAKYFILYLLAFFSPKVWFFVHRHFK